MKRIHENEYVVSSPPTVIRNSDSLYSVLQTTRQSPVEENTVSTIEQNNVDGLRFRGKVSISNTNVPISMSTTSTIASVSSNSNVLDEQIMTTTTTKSAASALDLVRTQSSRAINVVTDLLLGIERPPPSEEHLFSTQYRPYLRSKITNRHLRRRTTSGTIQLRDTLNTVSTTNISSNNGNNHHTGSTPLRRALSTGDLYYNN